MNAPKFSLLILMQTFFIVGLTAQEPVPKSDPSIQKKRKMWCITMYGSHSQSKDINKIKYDSLFEVIDTFQYVSSYGDLKVTLDWNPEKFSQLTTKTWLSTSNILGKIGHESHITLFDTHLLWKILLEGKKRIKTSLDDSLNIARGSMGFNVPLVKNRMKKFFSYSIDCDTRILTEQVGRNNSLGISYWHYELAPSIIFESNDMQKTLMLEMETGFKNYDTYLNTERDNFWFNPYVSASLYFNHLEWMPTLSYERYVYPYWRRHAQIYEPGSSVGLFFDSWINWNINSYLSLDNSLQFDYLKEEYPLYIVSIDSLDQSSLGFDTDTVKADIFINTLSLTQNIHIRFNETIACFFSCQYDKQMVDVSADNHVQEIKDNSVYTSNYAVTPGLGIRLKVNKHVFETGCTYSIIEYAKNFLEFEKNHHALEPYIDTNFNPYPGISIKVKSSYLYNFYDDDDVQSKGLSASLLMYFNF